MSRLKSAHDLSGLMKYMRRAPWDEMMDEMLVAHLGPACEATDLEPDDIFDIIGDHWESHLWGCAFEDLLTQELEPDGLNGDSPSGPNVLHSFLLYPLLTIAGTLP